MLTLFTDTDTDMSAQKAKEYGYRLISMPYSVDGNTVFPYEDFDVFDAKPFYDMLRAGTLPNTSAISKEKYISYFKPEFEAGNDILYVHFSRAMSATFDAMDAAVAELRTEYPDCKFYEVDTKGITILSLNIVEEIGQMYREGATAEQILAWAKEEVDHFAIVFFADDLKFFRHSGRVSGLKAMMGTLIGIRPIIYIGEEGKMVSIGSEKGRTRAVERLVRTVEENGLDLAGHRIIIGHTDAPEIAAEVEKLLRQRLGNLRIETIVVNPTAGAHCGPNGVGISFHATHR